MLSPSSPLQFRCPFLPHFLLCLIFVQFSFAEVAFWKDSASEFRHDGTCLLFDQSKGKYPPETHYANASKRYYPCGDPNYELMRQCQMASFYRDKLPQKSEVLGTDDGTLLFLVDGCVQCPRGNAKANIRLINSFPSGNWFSGCDEERIVVSSVNVTVNTPSSRDGVEMDGTFSLGGVLRERECGGFFGFGAGREGTFQSLMLEIGHNCGRKKEMLLKVKLPNLDIPAIKARGKIAELRGISVDLDISKGEWGVQTVEYERVRPKQKVPEQLEGDEGTFEGKLPGETHVQPTEQTTEEQRGDEAAEKRTDAPFKNDLSSVQNASASLRHFRPPSASPSIENKSVFWTIPSIFLQFAAIVLLFLFVLLLGCCVRCFLRRRK